MANRKIEKVPIDRDWFIATLKAKGFSVRSLGNPDSDNFINWHEKTIRRALDSERPAMTPKLLDDIAKKIDVYPDYLAGNYAWTLDVLDDEGARQHFMDTFMNPDNYPYIRKQQEDLSTHRHLLNTLLMHGIDEGQFKSLSQKDRDRLRHHLDLAITDVLKNYFPRCTTMERVDYIESFDWETEQDVIEAMFTYLEEHGLLVGSFGDEV